MVFLKLNNPLYYKQVAKLIYETDPYIYPDLFGNIRCAEKILPLLFENKGSRFYKDNYYLTLSKKRVVGIVAIYCENKLWSENATIEAFSSLKVKKPESFNYVNDYLNKIYTTNWEEGASICSICVKKKLRRRGIGSFLFRNAIDIIGNRKIILNVLCNNQGAIALYKKFGFSITRKFYDYGGYKREKALCYEMQLS